MRRMCVTFGCQNVPDVGEFRCPEHRLTELRGRQGIKVLSGGSIHNQRDEEALRGVLRLELRLRRFAIGLVVAIFVFGLLVLWGIVHGLDLPPILGGPGNP